MFKRKVLFAVVLALLVSLIASGAYAAFQALAIGSGQQILPDGTLRTFSFAAKELEDGSVFGHIEAEDTGDVYRYAYAELDCLNIVGHFPGIGDVAFMSGWITEAVNLPLDTQDPMYGVFGVIDGGTDPGAVDYLNTGHIVSGPDVENCHNTDIYSYWYWPVEGKIKVVTR